MAALPEATEASARAQAWAMAARCAGVARSAAKAAVSLSSARRTSTTSSTAPRLASTLASKASGRTASSAATNTPEPWRAISKPVERSRLTASRTTVRDTANWAASSVSVGSLSPGTNAPDSIRLRSSLASRSDKPLATRGRVSQVCGCTVAAVHADGADETGAGVTAATDAAKPTSVFDGLRGRRLVARTGLGLSDAASIAVTVRICHRVIIQIRTRQAMRANAQRGLSQRGPAAVPLRRPVGAGHADSPRKIRPCPGWPRQQRRARRLRGRPGSGG